MEDDEEQTARPKRGRGRPRRDRHPIDAGPLPSDPLAVAGEYVPRVAAIMLEQVLLDPDMSDDERRKEARHLMRLLATTVPYSRVAQAERVVRGTAEDMDRNIADATLKEVEGEDAGGIRIDPVSK